MRKTISIIILAAVTAIPLGCTSNHKEIEQASYGYLKAMGNYQIDDAFAYATEETQTKTLAAIQQYIMPNTDLDYIKKNTPAEISITNIEMIDDTSAIVSFHKKTPIQEQDGTLDMRKRSDGWKAQVIINLPVSIQNAGKDTFHFPDRDTSHLQVLVKQ